MSKRERKAMERIGTRLKRMGWNDHHRSGQNVGRSNVVSQENSRGNIRKGRDREK